MSEEEHYGEDGYWIIVFENGFDGGSLETYFYAEKEKAEEKLRELEQNWAEHKSGPDDILVIRGRRERYKARKQVVERVEIGGEEDEEDDGL